MRTIKLKQKTTTKKEIPKIQGKQNCNNNSEMGRKIKKKKQNDTMK